MSSATNRGGERVAFDFYPTPPWCVDRLLDRHAKELGLLRRNPRVLEPTVGDGAIVRAVDCWIENQAPEGEAIYWPFWTGVEIRRGAMTEALAARLDRHFEGIDFRTWTPAPACARCRSTGHVVNTFGRRVGCYECDRGRDLGRAHPFTLALGNPPFALAEAIVRRALTVSRVVAMLLRVDFLGSAERHPFWTGVGANPILRILPDRPSFDGEGTDSSTYAWYVWGAELSGPRVDVLDPTPASVRAAQKPRPPAGIPQLGINWPEPQDTD